MTWRHALARLAYVAAGASCFLSDYWTGRAAILAFALVLAALAEMLLVDVGRVSVPTRNGVSLSGRKENQMFSRLRTWFRGQKGSVAVEPDQASIAAAGILSSPETGPLFVATGPQPSAKKRPLPSRRVSSYYTPPLPDRAPRSDDGGSGLLTGFVIGEALSHSSAPDSTTSSDNSSSDSGSSFSGDGGSSGGGGASGDW